MVTLMCVCVCMCVCTCVCVFVTGLLFIFSLQYVVTGSTEGSESANQSVPFHPILLQTIAVSQPVTRLVWSGRGDEAVFATTEDTVSAWINHMMHCFHIMAYFPPPYYVGNEAVLTTSMNTNCTNHKHQQIHLLINTANILFVINT